MAFNREDEFEDALIKLLTDKYKWDSNVLEYKTEDELIQNWADILYKNNNCVDKLNGCPLTKGEMSQIMEQIAELRTPLKLNGFINGKSVAIKRENPNDVDHLGKEVSLKIYDRQEIAAGKSVYQIARQPIFKAKKSAYPNRRGDFCLLINGMPVIHVELKKSGVDVSQACNQIEKYAHEGVFTGLFSLVQVFVAMNPEECVYFANPGPDGVFKKEFFFHWADSSNEPINDWDRIAEQLLSIPMAHELIGYYTVADKTDGILKVMRSYQYYAASKISNVVKMHHWDEYNQRGGHIWHTTGSGKTLTSFKSAQLISTADVADKVVFLMDRIELGTQSFLDYAGFSENPNDIQQTENTDALINYLESDDPQKTLIVTSIQKMNIVAERAEREVISLDKINSKRIVVIIDEAHRSTFGDMLQRIKKEFSNCLMFGFTGTPILEANSKKDSTTVDIFGDELHRYTIADGIRDKNVLGFDPTQVLVYRDMDIRKVVALQEAKAQDEAEAIADSKKSAIYYYYLDSTKVPMVGYVDDNGDYVKGIEDYLPKTQYQTEEYKTAIVNDIKDNWLTLSRGGKFHAIFATSNIPEAIEYYKLIKKMNWGIKCTALFDPHEGNDDASIYKEDAIVEILDDYYEMYGRRFTMTTYPAFKKDVALRFAHKDPYLGLEKDPKNKLDILIVVDQMLTGFDSKWINTLYLDKILKSEKIIQAFSRTNRIYNSAEKPFGIIRYYRKPHTMRAYIEEAFKAYSGESKYSVFVSKLEKNLNDMNDTFSLIKQLFNNAGIMNFEKLPQDKSERAMFAKLFKLLNQYLDAAKIQDFTWDKLNYSFSDDKGDREVTLAFDETTYLVLVLRYKELFGGGSGKGPEEVPYEIDTHITEINTGVIDTDYMNSRFKKYIKALQNGEETADILDELHKSFATLSEEEQKYAKVFLNDIYTGDVIVNPSKTLREYITEYMVKAKNDRIHIFACTVGVDEEKLREILSWNCNEITIKQFGRLDKLKSTVNKTVAAAYLSKLEGKTVLERQVPMKIEKVLRDFILHDKFEA